MGNLTPAEKLECQKVISAIIDMYWVKIKTRMLVNGEPFEVALEQVKMELLNE